MKFDIKMTNRRINHILGINLQRGITEKLGMRLKTNESQNKQD